MIYSKQAAISSTRAIALLACLSITLAFSQTDGESQLLKSYGIKIGISSASQDWSYNPTSSIIANSVRRNGLDIGIYAEWFNVPYFSVISEGHFIQKGSRVSKYEHMLVPTSGIYFSGYSPRVNYVSVPILAKVRFSVSTIEPYLLFGPHFNYILSHSGMVASNNIDRFDIGATMGVGVGVLSISQVHFGAEFRYSPSFTNIYSVSSLTVGDGTVSELKVRNSSLEFLVVMSY